MEQNSTPNPNVQGLDPEQQQRAAELYANANEKALALQGVKDAIVARWTSERAASGSIHRVSTNLEDAKYLWASHRANSSRRKAARHYRKNAAAYQDEALLEAIEAGHTINGWDKDGN